MLEDRQINKSVPIPLYFQLKTLILEEIENGAYPVDTLIPTENEISAMFSISRTTVRQAIMELVQEGKLYRVKSKGTYVASPKIHQEFVNRLLSYNEEILASGRTPSTVVLSMEVLPIPAAVAKGSGLPADSKVICLYRKRLADGKPVVRVKTYLPLEPCRFVLNHDFSKESLYGVLSLKEETRIRHISRIMEAVLAEPEDVRILEMKPGMPVHFFTSVGYNAAEQVIEYSLAYYRGDQNQFHVDIYADS